MSTNGSTTRSDLPTGNVLTPLAVKSSKKLRASSTNVFVVSLAASDGMIGITLPPIVAFNLWNRPEVWTITACALIARHYAMFNISLFLLLAIAADRFVAIVYPLSYRDRVTRRLAILGSIVIWMSVFGLITSVTCYYGSRDVVENFNPSDAQKLYPKEFFLSMVQSTVMIPIGGNVALYFLIFIKLRKGKKVVATVARSGQSTEVSGSHISRRTKAFTKMMLLVLGYLILACIPYYVLVSVHDVTDPMTRNWYIYMFDMSIILFYSNLFMNPVIYSWKSRDFRDAYKKVLKLRRPDSRLPDNETSIQTANDQ
ncbi:hypothetical protein LSH36_560g00000 [Paralvinella palmiformis]|uniref:G-protein coupled receptors family 1 profile domain-containing protein n=1 Tax=Paralvinella palmiformis TaxID=53620 RepID=A0AAD9MXF0_9ANNE|nr:hypothetical protein LSH36_560g00000 [Paralvinella palmiformis]